MSARVLEVQPLGFPWVTADPFLFCVHHDDAYPEGTEAMSPAASLTGRKLGMDFEGKDGWRMYHGQVVPGFPQHPHRGFETVTIVRRGYCDHSDSLGATARFGSGDVQWLTAGGGIVHSEMFPLLERDRPNPLELFQIWLNLPSSDKMVAPHFTMLWDKDIPHLSRLDDGQRKTDIRVVTGSLSGERAPSPPPHSWASRADSDVAIVTVRMDAGASVRLPPAQGDDTTRIVYFFRGRELTVGDHQQTSHAVLAVESDQELLLRAGGDETEVLLLQGRPIGEPVVQYGPFVMNSRDEIEQAIRDYQRTRFGGWPWPKDDPVHPRDAGRFARHADGNVERL